MSCHEGAANPGSSCNVGQLLVCVSEPAGCGLSFLELKYPSALDVCRELR